MPGLDPHIWEQLLELAPPPDQPVHPGTDEEWARAAERLGHPFPKDYEAIVRTYGEGHFHQFLRILPVSSEGQRTDIFSGRASLQRMFQLPDAMNDIPFKVLVDEDKLLTWGATEGADTLFWITHGEPDDWKVLVADEKWINWSGYCNGLLEFLLGVLEGRSKVPWFPNDLTRIGKPFSRNWWWHIDWGRSVDGAEVAHMHIRDYREQRGFWPMSLDDIEWPEGHRELLGPTCRYYPPKQHHEGFVLVQGTPEPNPPWELEGRSFVVYIGRDGEYLEDNRLEALLREYEGAGETVVWPSAPLSRSGVLRTGTLRQTEGPNVELEIECSGRVRVVAEGLPAPGMVERKPGEKAKICFQDDMSIDDVSVPFLEDNPQKRYGLEQIAPGRYRAYGRIINVDPVVVDCGPLQVEDIMRSTDRRLIGEWVAFTIGRLQAIGHTVPEGKENA
jgi:hypothetical protein